MNGMMGTMSSVMKAPRDVIIKIQSYPIMPVGKESQIKLLVLILNKTTQRPGVQVILL